MTTGYRTALLSSDPDIHGLLQAAPHVAGIPILVNVPAFGIVMFITWLLLRGARESSRANNIMVVIKLLALALFIAVGVTHITPANYVPFAPNGFTGIHQGAAIVFFAYIGFDAISTAAEETREPAAEPADRHSRRPGDLHVIYVIVGAVLTGHGAVHGAGEVGRPARVRAADCRDSDGRLGRGARRRGVDGGGAARLPVRAAADLLLDGARRAAAAVGGEACTRARASRHTTTLAHRRLVVALARARRRRGGNLRPDEHRDAVRVRAGLHRRARAAREGARAAAAVQGAARAGRWRRSAPRRACSSWSGCRRQAWERFGIWLAIGLALYFAYGFWHSRLHVR